MQEVSVEELKSALEHEHEDQDVDFINVCTPAEYAQRHIPGVRSVPLDELATHVGELSKKKKIYVHCRSGGRSALAIAQLEKLGVPAELVNVQGGLLDWEDVGLPTHSVGACEGEGCGE